MSSFEALARFGARYIKEPRKIRPRKESRLRIAALTAALPGNMRRSRSSFQSTTHHRSGAYIACGFASLIASASALLASDNAIARWCHLPPSTRCLV